jgi:hypothetical protein
MRMKRTTDRRRTRSISIWLSLLALLGSFLQAQTVSAETIEAIAPVTTGEIPAPPPVPVSGDGNRLDGQWVGPYTFRNVHSGKCLDMSGTADAAQAVQYQCLAGNTSQAWYLWMTGGDGSVAFHLFGNSNTGKCLQVFSFIRGAAVQQYPCSSAGPGYEWGRTVANMNLYWNRLTNFCMEVGGWSTANAAPVIQWDCFGNNNQLWMQHAWH